MLGLKSPSNFANLLTTGHKPTSVSQMRSHELFASALASGYRGLLLQTHRQQFPRLTKHELSLSTSESEQICITAKIIFALRLRCLCYCQLSIYDIKNNVNTSDSSLSPSSSSPPPPPSPSSPALACSLACMMSIHWEQHITIIHGKSTPQSQTDRSKDVDDRWGQWWLG